MEKRRLGKSDLNLSVLGFGCASYWGMPYFSETEAVSLVHRALELGINFFDTGHSYSHGNAEPRLGRLLQTLPKNRRSELIISTKAGTRNNKYLGTYKDFSPAWVAKSVEMSLSQLGLERIPVFHLHGPQNSNFTPELVRLIEDLKASGKIGVLCVNSFEDDVLEFCLKTDVVDCVMLDYNILRQDREDLITRYSESGKGVIAGAALANHVFVHPLKKLRKPQDVWYLLRAMKNHRQSIEKAKKYQWIQSVENFSPNQIAIAFALENPKISCSVFGTTRLKHLEENVSAATIKLPRSIVARLRETHGVPAAQLAQA